MYRVWCGEWEKVTQVSPWVFGTGNDATIARQEVQGRKHIGWQDIELFRYTDFEVIVRHLCWNLV